MAAPQACFADRPLGTVREQRPLYYRYTTGTATVMGAIQPLRLKNIEYEQTANILL